MREGLLWFDNNPERDLTAKVNRAAQRYQARLNQKPTVCYVNTAQYGETLEEIDGIHLKTAANIQPHHFWIGVEQERSESRAA